MRTKRGIAVLGTPVFMMSVIAALTLGGSWKIEDKDSIITSFPSFLKILNKLGAKIN